MAITTVATMWSPRLSRPVTAMWMSSPSIAVTLPVRVRVSLGVERNAQAQRDLLDDRARPGPVGDEPLHQAGIGEDIDEDVLGAALDRLVAIVVHILEIPGGQRGTDDEGGIGVDHQLRQFGTDRDGGRFDGGSHAITFQYGSAVSSSSFSKSTCTGRPTST